MTHEPKCKQQLDSVGRWMGLMTDPKLTPDSPLAVAETLRAFADEGLPGARTFAKMAVVVDDLVRQWRADIAERDAWKRRYLLAVEGKGDV